MEKYLAVDKLPDWFPLHHFNPPAYRYATGPDLLDWKQTSLYAFVGMTVFNPIFWNTVARNEYRNKSITKVLGSPYTGCYLLAATIFSLSGFRDSLFLAALKDQPALEILGHPAANAAAVAFFASGQVFVLSSMWALGVTGTYLGDYFGILMSHRVTGFPFNVLNDPMYVGSFLTHLGTALWYRSPAGIVLAFWVLGVYLAALRFEGPFTDKIYSSAASSKKTSSAGSSSAPATPTRKSSRIAAKVEPESSADESYAQVASSKTPGKTGATPRRRSALQQAKAEAAGEGSASPMRMTRSRSKGRGMGSETD